MSSPQDAVIIETGKAGSALREWSSIIGIVTAIVGNILISFALNIQRYAHIRLEREQDRLSDPWGEEHKKNGAKNYGTQQGEYAEERARLNRKAPVQQDGVPLDQDAPSKLVQPQDSAASIHSNSSSDSTIKPIEQPSPPSHKKTYLESPYWWGGIILMTTGEAGNFLAYGFAPASIVSPLGVVALVSNCIIAPCLLKERFRQRDFWGVMTAIAGAVVIVLSAKNSENKMGPDDVWAAITRWEFETYLGITAGLMIVLLWASEKYGEKTILIDLGLVGLFGGYTALSTKGVASLLSDTLWRALTFPITYLLLFVLVVTALMQIRYVNRALQRFDSTQVIPVQFVLFTISVIVGSAILYRDFKSATGDRIGKFIGGCLLTFLGVYLITSGRTQAHGEGVDDIDDEEDAIGLVDEEEYQDEVASPHNEHSRRQSSMSIRFDDHDGAPQSRRSSKQQMALSPSTPIRTLSRASTASTQSEDRSPVSLKSPYRASSNSNSNHLRPTALESSVSSPLLPSEATRTPDTIPSTPSRPSNLTRRSMARLTPGPLMSPLSSSLSAVVADERRRNANGSTLSPRRPRLSGLRKSRSSKGGGRGASSEETAMRPGVLPLKGVEVPEQAVEDDGAVKAGRSKSFGDVLGMFLRRGSKGKGSERD